ncbi:hypothetical protein HHK36_026326 [Tetracentron sinense]|uniref:Uncharacterized protein n=1 Tax=Tetracentron sinense TaxID=13715 RepID=A0A834YF74_TETSI|nr:hypothetical protein HHK36_026326 [Tetracentron sinense]
MDSSSSSVVSEGRGIPGDSFVEDVLKYLSKSGLDVNSFLAFLQERIFAHEAYVVKIDRCMIGMFINIEVGKLLLRPYGEYSGTRRSFILKEICRPNEVTRH